MMTPLIGAGAVVGRHAPALRSAEVGVAVGEIEHDCGVTSKLHAGVEGVGEVGLGLGGTVADAVAADTLTSFMPSTVSVAKPMPAPMYGVKPHQLPMSM